MGNAATSHPEFEWSYILLCPTPQLHHQVAVTLGHVTSHPNRIGSIDTPKKQKLVKMKMFVFPLIVVLYSLWTVCFLFFFKLYPQILNKIFWIKGTCWARRGVSLRGSSLWEAWCCSHTGCSSSWSRCCQGYWGQSPLSLWELCWDTKTCCSDAKMLNWRKKESYIQARMTSICFLHMRIKDMRPNCLWTLRQESSKNKHLNKGTKNLWTPSTFALLQNKLYTNFKNGSKG